MIHRDDNNENLFEHNDKIDTTEAHFPNLFISTYHAINLQLKFYSFNQHNQRVSINNFTVYSNTEITLQTYTNLE